MIRVRYLSIMVLAILSCVLSDNSSVAVQVQALGDDIFEQGECLYNFDGNWEERFEATGFDEAYTSINLHGVNDFDPDHDSAVVNRPSWGSQFLLMGINQPRTAALVRQCFAAPVTGLFSHFEFIPLPPEEGVEPEGIISVAVAKQNHNTSADQVAWAAHLVYQDGQSYVLLRFSDAAEENGYSTSATAISEGQLTSVSLLYTSSGAYYELSIDGETVESRSITPVVEDIHYVVIGSSASSTGSGIQVGIDNVLHYAQPAARNSDE